MLLTAFALAEKVFPSNQWHFHEMDKMERRRERCPKVLLLFCLQSTEVMESQLKKQGLGVLMSSWHHQGPGSPEEVGREEDAGSWLPSAHRAADLNSLLGMRPEEAGGSILEKRKQFPAGS